MKLIVKQKFLSWFDSYNVYDEWNNIVFKIKGTMSWGHKFIIYDANDNEIGCVREKIFKLLPAFEVFNNERKLGVIKKKFSLFTPKYYFDLGDYNIEGNYWDYDYNVMRGDQIVATIRQKLISFTDTYVIETNEEDALNVMLIAIAIDADKCSDGD